ncbi:catabolite control protein [Treponema primitia ZAS-2]|uniref:Catabolite control protein n=1 Tax=Treponema primitia (strain ATCC BAA-887 / DSM 12427 / ZAS-2) TaxID=545694 RepID=F5YM97_TREPZ|nr:LacI family DNA-binding transcriptional regulator [Treponema primitia]AEF83725.1 catabolite control protein [Treponema primitia ZAS-2]
MISIKDIARQSGTSVSTVSRVVNEKSHVHPKKRELILKIIEETGYAPNKAARSMVLQRSFTVGLMIPDIFNLFQQQLFSMIERHLESLGYHTLFFLIKDDEASEEECLSRLRKEKLDGVILFGRIKKQEIYEFIEREKLPAIAATCCYNGIPSVMVNDKQAAFEGVCHLVSLGHRRIALIDGPDFYFSSDRMDGYCQALAAAGVVGDEKRMIQVRHQTADFGMEGMRELLNRGRDFSAVFAVTDEIAIGAVRVLRDAGLRVPEDISVMGFDDISMASYVVPRLTTIQQPISEMGKQTAQLIHHYINGDSTLISNVVLPHKLIIRESTAAVSDDTSAGDRQDL